MVKLNNLGHETGFGKIAHGYYVFMNSRVKPRPVTGNDFRLVELAISLQSAVCKLAEVCNLEINTVLRLLK